MLCTKNHFTFKIIPSTKSFVSQWFKLSRSMTKAGKRMFVCLFVWFVILGSSQHIKVMSSAISYPVHTIPWQAPLGVNQY